MRIETAESLVIALNSVIRDKYKPVEAKAVLWEKRDDDGNICVSRIYLKGKKANGFIHRVDGVWEIEGCNFSFLLSTVRPVLEFANC